MKASETTRKHMNCDFFIGKLCGYRNSTPSSMLFLILERNTTYEYPVYRVLYSSGCLSTDAAFNFVDIEEVKL